MLSIHKKQPLNIGNSAIVYSGFFNEQPVAIKKSKSPDYSAIFSKECRILKALEHVNIIKLVHNVQKDDGIYLALELMALGDLFDLITNQYDAFNALRCIQITLDIINGLEYLHHRGFLHRDIKPENIMLNENWQAKIGDFGAAIEEENALTTAERLVGTPYYMSPELAQAKKNHHDFLYSRRNDIYALGVSLLFMINRDKIIVALPSEIEQGKRGTIPADKHPGLAGIVSRCLVVDLNDRIDTPELAQLISQVAPT
jgi:serine/threonine protein kinase